MSRGESMALPRLEGWRRGPWELESLQTDLFDFTVVSPVPQMNMQVGPGREMDGLPSQRAAQVLCVCLVAFRILAHGCFSL